MTGAAIFLRKIGVLHGGSARRRIVGALQGVSAMPRIFADNPPLRKDLP